MPNTAILVTKMFDYHGNAMEVIDFCPRYSSYNRVYRPNTLVRIVRPIQGAPRLRVKLAPTFGYGWGTPERTRGSNHIRYILSNGAIRLTTSAPISYIMNETLFNLDETMYLVLMPDESLTDSAADYCNTTLEKTKRNWTEWVATLSVPIEYQQVVIRAAITLKLSSYEETGAIVASMTTSIPRSPNFITPNDYRYCFVRDAGAVVRALNSVGITKTMEDYLRFISNAISGFDEDGKENWLQPVYGIGSESRLHPKPISRLAGYRGFGPVVVGTKDYQRKQNDIYGTVILSLTQVFFDERLDVSHRVDQRNHLFHLMEKVGEIAKQVYKQQDDRENNTAVHTYSAVMCWAGCDRLSKISKRLAKADREDYWSNAAAEIKDWIIHNCYNSELNSFVSEQDGKTVSTYLLLLPIFGLINANDPKFLGTLALIEQRLKKGDYLLRVENDDASAFSLGYVFWYISVLQRVGRNKEARDLFERILKRANHTGLVSETICAADGSMWGNFPHTASTAGIIECAMGLSEPWSSVI